jgi:hypothetical protein
MEHGATEEAATDREGFEPSKRFKPFTRSPGVRLQPLGHLSRLVARAQLSGLTKTRQRAGITWVGVRGVWLEERRVTPSRWRLDPEPGWLTGCRP